MRHLLSFVIIWVACLTTGLAYIEVSVPGAIGGLVFADWWTPIPFAAGVSAIVYFSCFVLFQLFGTTTFHTSVQGITIRQYLFGFSRTRHLPRDELRYLEQIKDGGEGGDSFPSWGLRLIGRRKVWLLSRQPIDKSDWLGQFLAQQLDLEYRQPTGVLPSNANNKMLDVRTGNGLMTSG
jgi:hypothetical protein